MAVIRDAGISHWVLRPDSQALVLLEEGPEKGWYNVGICGRDEALSVNHHLLSFNLRLKQSSTLGQVWHSEAEMLQRHSASRNGCTGAVCQGKHKMLHGKTFSAGNQRPLWIKM